MNTIQVTACQLGIYVKNRSQLHVFHFKPCVFSMDAIPPSVTSLGLRAKPPSGLQCLPILKSQRPLHVCLAGGKGMMENNEDFQRKALEEAMENFKGQSIEDILRQQMQKGEYFDNGGRGAKPPAGGGGGGGPGGSDGGMSNETRQVILAIIGFIFLYISVINGLELAKLGRDYIKYLFGGPQSVRLKRFMYKWSQIYNNITEKKEGDNNGVEKVTSWWHNPSIYRDVFKNYMKSNSD